MQQRGLRDNTRNASRTASFASGVKTIIRVRYTRLNSALMHYSNVMLARDIIYFRRPQQKT